MQSRRICEVALFAFRIALQQKFAKLVEGARFLEEVACAIEHVVRRTRSRSPRLNRRTKAQVIGAGQKMDRRSNPRRAHDVAALDQFQEIFAPKILKARP